MKEAIAILITGILMILGGAFGVMILWNLLIPTIFGIATITFWQSMGLLVLSNLLFKNNSSWKRED